MAELQEPVLSPNAAIDAYIKEMLPAFSQESQRRMRRAILDAKRAAVKHRDEDTDAGARHTFREFIPAFWLNKNGYSLEYEKLVQGQKPDWVDDQNDLMLESYTYERGGTTGLVDRVVAAVNDKYRKYRNIIESNRFRFVVAVYLDFMTCVTLDECREESASFRQVFTDNAALWGILFFTETQVVRGRQEYGFLCLCAEPSLASTRNWPFQTMSVAL